jgi:hypothetical protein
VLKRATSLLTSPTLAIALLVVVLVCCVVGVTIFRGERAGKLIFATLWFNGLLVLLALSAATAFFSRIWRRKLSLVSVGMIVFHVSFVALLGGIVINSLFFFHGVLRLTEGETLPNGQLESYDQVDQGRFFDFSRLRGETTLVKMHANFKVDGANKRAAYEIAVVDGEAKAQGTIYVTQYLDFEGSRFFCMKEGYSVLIVMSDKAGGEIFGVHVALQSYKRTDESFLYASGTASGAAGFDFPPPPEHPRAELKVSYQPGPEERTGQVSFEVSPFGPPGVPLAELRSVVPVGGQVDAGDFLLSPREIRYWVGMNVRYDPGQIVILSSLCLGLAGMVVTFVGRVRQGAAKRRAAEVH